VIGEAESDAVFCRRIRIMHLYLPLFTIATLAESPLALGDRMALPQ
jgi:hypothetical protein